MEKYYLNPHIFLKIEKNQLLLWNYKSHEQFLVDLEYLQEILNIDEQNISKNTEIRKELLEAGIISTQAYEDYDWGWDDQSKIFHIGTSDISSVSEEMPELDEGIIAETYLGQCEKINVNTELFLEREGKVIDLPKPNSHEINEKKFLDAIMQRKTCRVFNGKHISLEKLSTILFYSFGQPHDTWSEFKELGLKQTAIHKVSPSGGGRHPEEAFITVYRVDDLTPGLYHYRIKDHKLTLISEGDFEKEVMILNNKQAFSKGLAFGVYIVACCDRTWAKYKHSRAYRVIYLDIGHVSQTLQLCASALDLNTWLSGGFEDQLVSDFLGLDRIKQFPVLFVGIGESTGQAIPQAMYERLKQMK